MTVVATLSHSSQVRRLSRLAWAALVSYAMPEAQLTPLTHTYNTTFRVTRPIAATGGRMWRSICGG